MWFRFVSTWIWDFPFQQGFDQIGEMCACRLTASISPGSTACSGIEVNKWHREQILDTWRGSRHKLIRLQLGNIITGWSSQITSADIFFFFFLLVVSKYQCWRGWRECKAFHYCCAGRSTTFSCPARGCSCYINTQRAAVNTSYYRAWPHDLAAAHLRR